MTKYTKKNPIPNSDLYLKTQTDKGQMKKLPIGDNIQHGNTLIIGDAHTGKTSLALSIASHLRRKYPDALFVFVNEKKEYLPLFQKDTDTLFSCHDKSPHRHFRWNLSEECLLCGDPKKELINCIDLLFWQLPKNSDMDLVKEILFTAFIQNLSCLHPSTVDVPANRDISWMLQHRSLTELQNMLIFNKNKTAFSNDWLDITNEIIKKLSHFLFLFDEGSNGSGYDTISSFLNLSGSALFLDDDNTESSRIFIFLLLSLILRKKQEMSEDSKKKIYLILDDPCFINNIYFSGIPAYLSEHGSRSLLICNTLLRKFEGFSNLIAFRTTDEKTLDFEQQYYGESKRFHLFKNTLHIKSVAPTKKNFLISASELMSLNTGNAYVKIQDSAPIKLHFQI